MHIVYYTAARTGSGHAVGGIALANAVRRAGLNANVTVTGTFGFHELLDAAGVPSVPIVPEDFDILNERDFEKSETWKTLTALKPDVLVIDLAWYTTHTFVDQLACPSILLLRQVDENFFAYRHGDELIRFSPERYSLVVAKEPWSFPFPVHHINPIVLRNPHEILNREQASSRLGIDAAAPTALIATNGKPAEFERLYKDYAYLEDEYQLVTSTNHHSGLFPLVDYFNAFDFVVCSAGYHAFWECMYFEKTGVFVPQERRFENQAWRISACQDYEFTANGADELVRLISDGF